MRDWIIIGILYLSALVAFRRLGGLRAAAGAFRSWGGSAGALRSGRISPTSG